MDVHANNGVLHVFSTLEGQVRLSRVNGEVLSECWLADGEALLKVGTGGVYLVTVLNEHGEYTKQINIP